MKYTAYAEKNYIFVIFQGDQQKTIYEGKVPANGKFTLHIPKEYAPYNGMARWLITGTTEGGGLDMYIPGKNFSAGLTEDNIPVEKSTFYTDNTAFTEIGNLFREQTNILSRYEAMQQAVKAYTPNDTNYTIFQQEYQNQLKAYDNFQQKLKTRNDYESHFIRIVNITKGISPQLAAPPLDIAKNIEQYISNELDWQVLYTSGQWTAIINTWLNIHTQVIKNHEQFSADFQKVSNRITSPAIYINLAKTIAHYLSQQGQDEYINAIAPVITKSGKISNYSDELAVYIKATTGSQAPNLIIPKQDADDKTQTIKITDKAFQQTLLFFYQSSDCNTCDQQLKELATNYQKLANQGIRVITLSADKEKEAFINKAKTFPWKDAYCDYRGKEGKNFKNYGITGVPSIILIDSNGKILSRGASINF
ncbi:peroxiredoxin family protein [Elizabethkingia ursingii]|uniref:peroxiredoxin family protein n=1 Tax=Elizabethkingia ursingii TaxID=1756150 RepID=UPI002010D806|nr:thioredoxin family protein [Elizabethkingia ursingii]MCL1672981.1 thioredoxin family protein [Elizabethkingia ursingii]